MVGLKILALAIGVRIPVSQPNFLQRPVPATGLFLFGPFDSFIAITYYPVSN